MMKKPLEYVVTMLAMIMVAGESGNCLAQKKTAPLPARAPERSAPVPPSASLEA